MALLLDYLHLILRIGLITDPFTLWQQLLKVQRIDVYEPGQHEAVIPYIEEYFQAYPEDLKRLSLTHALLVEQLQQGMQQQTKKLLLRQLGLKFTVLPDAVRRRVETTENLELLENWLTQVTLANSLAETELGKALA